MSNKEHKEKNPPEEEKPGTGVTVYDFGDDAGAGMEDVKREEFKIPFLAVLDAKSPQCKPKSAGGMGLKPGDIYNTATGESYDGEKGIDFVPVKRDENYPEFISRKDDGSGGGFVGIRAPDDSLVLQLRKEQGKFGRLKVPPQSGGTWEPGIDHELSQTYYLYGLLVVEGNTPSPVLIAFKSTQIGKYQGFITRQQSIQYPTAKGIVKPPLWSHVWHFSTRYEEKNGRSWYGWVVALKHEPSRESLLQMNDPLYQMGKELYTSITGGQKTADYAAHAQTENAKGEEEIPM
jgi:hypothetical protein